MKKSFYLSAYAFALLFSIGMLFKLMHWPIANILIVSSVQRSLIGNRCLVPILVLRSLIAVGVIIGVVGADILALIVYPVLI